MKKRITDRITDSDRNEVFNGLLAYNLDRIDDKNPKDLGIYYEDENSHKVAGLIAQTHGNWLTIKYLWVAEHYRRQHIGSSLLEEAEQAAIERGCKYVFLDTFDFQAPDFYKKHGYKEVFVLENYPRNGKRYYFTKSLSE